MEQESVYARQSRACGSHLKPQLLTSDERHITYVDKQRNCKTYNLTDELVGCNSKIAKRLKYTMEILQQLVSAQKPL
jgi:transcriptional antiterminator